MKMKEFTIYIPDEEVKKFGIREALPFWREAGLSRINVLSCNGGMVYGTVCVDERIEEEDIEPLESFQLLGKKRCGHTYLFELTMDESDRIYCPNKLFCDGELTVTDHGIEMVGVASQSVIHAFHEMLRERDVSFELHQIRDYNGQETLAESLTDRQQEVLRCAYDMGYYDVPRSVTMTDIASQLQLDKSTISEHLQRAERKILSTVC